MTEQEYVLAKAQGTITSAINTLRDVSPDMVESIMTKKEYQDVMQQLYIWQGKLFVQIKIDQE